MLAVLSGVFVTREAGAEFLPLSRSIAHIGQTFPPVAVLALAVPAVGFGVKPTMIALVLYGLLPIFENTIVGLRQLPQTTLEAADGMGHRAPSGDWSRSNCRWRSRSSWPGCGFRSSSISALRRSARRWRRRGSGEVIIAGLNSSNTAFVAAGRRHRSSARDPDLRWARFCRTQGGAARRAGGGIGPRGGDALCAGAGFVAPCRCAP